MFKGVDLEAGVAKGRGGFTTFVQFVVGGKKPVAQ